MINAIQIFVSVIRFFPLWVMLVVKQRLLNDEEAKKFNEDIRYFGKRFFPLLAQRPFYVMMLYRRLGKWSKLLRPWCGSYMLFVRDKDVMSLDGGVYLDHPHGTRVGAVSIGRDLQLKHNVTIGNSDGQFPTIGDNVFCGCGSCILGGIHVGNNVVIGANAVVVRDVPDDAVVVGNPARIVRLRGERVDIALT